MPEYAVGTVPVGPSGPVNKVYLQTHLPPGADVVDVLLDGKSSPWLPFVEAQRPAVGIDLSLPPREVKEVRIVFDEPASGEPGVVQVQPMARDAVVSVRERGC
jgi:hypothetical protein